MPFPFVLVHGSGQNAGCWARVGERLAARGHRVAAPDLPKHAPAWDLAAYAEEIAGVTEPQAVVVAHSFSSVFLPLVAIRRPCALLVFLCAVIPEPGKSVRQQFAEDPGMFHREWVEAGPRWFVPGEEAGLARRFLFHDCAEEALPWALSTVELCDTRHLVTEPVPFSAWPGVPVASIVAAEDRTLAAAWGRRTTRRVLGREAIELPAGHCPHTSRAEEVASLLERLAAAGG